MIHKRKREPRKNHSSGFTLIETLLALALTLVLILAVQSAMYLHWKYRTAGAEQALEATSTLAVVEDLATDLRLAESGISPTEMFLRRDVEAGNSDFLKLPDFQEETEIRERFLNISTPELISQPLGFVGTESLVIFDVAANSYRFSNEKHQASGQSVVWFVNRKNGIRLPVHRGQSHLEWRNFRSSQLPQGLIRVVLNRSRMQSNTPTELSPATVDFELIDPSVKQIQFQYIANQKFSPRWDSFEKKSLPRGLQIMFERETAIQQSTLALPQALSNSERGGAS